MYVSTRYFGHQPQYKVESNVINLQSLKYMCNWALITEVACSSAQKQ